MIEFTFFFSLKVNLKTFLEIGEIFKAWNKILKNRTTSQVFNMLTLLLSIYSFANLKYTIVAKLCDGQVKGEADVEYTIGAKLCDGQVKGEADVEAAALDLHAEDIVLNRRLGAHGAPLLRQTYDIIIVF